MPGVPIAAMNPLLAVVLIIGSLSGMVGYGAFAFGQLRLSTLGIVGQWVLIPIAVLMVWL